MNLDANRNRCPKIHVLLISVTYDLFRLHLYGSLTTLLLIHNSSKRQFHRFLRSGSKLLATTAHLGLRLRINKVQHTISSIVLQVTSAREPVTIQISAFSGVQSRTGVTPVTVN